MPSNVLSPLWGSGSTDPVITVGTAGPVWLTGIDINGCGVSDTAMVSVFAFAQPLAVTGSTICLGQSATLAATGSGTISWYDGASLAQLLHSGAQWTINQPLDSAVFYVVQTEGMCSSDALPVALNVVPTPNDAQVEATAPVCLGAPFQVWVSGTGDPTGAWFTPNGTFNGPLLSVAAAAIGDQGVYTVVPAIGGCAGDTVSISIMVIAPQPPMLQDEELCDGGTVVLALPSGYSNGVWSTGAAGNSVIVGSGGSYSVMANDINGCAVTAEVDVVVVDCDPHIPNVITPNGDGSNDGFRLPPGGYVSALLRVWNRWGQMVWEGDATNGGFRGNHRNGEPLSEGTYYYEVLITRADGAVKPHTGHLSLLR
ncbi:MAG TPA: gliding motility-associated C-terminal domain-containing protein [Flavobacteriales bacterium]|nr:gliding motility-associated C-terminal domain-containing protein [Flavobacteriales bacterium]